MTRGELLRELIRSGVARDHGDFERFAQRLIDEEREKKHHLLANDLERILHGEHATSHRPTPVGGQQELPRDSESGLPLVELVAPLKDLDDIVLSRQADTVVRRMLLEQNRRELLQTFGLNPVQRLLFYGPPGCGKTVTAEAIAGELSLYLVRVRFDGIISSFLGETAVNLGKVFEFLSHGRYVVVFDEFDAIAKDRDDASEHGELKRVVNALLLMMDGYKGSSILIAATNHDNLLDNAVWRRFDEIVYFGSPPLEDIAVLIKMKLRGVHKDLPLHDPHFINKFSGGMSHADIERVLLRAVKTMVLSGEHTLSRDMVEQSLEWERMRISSQ